MTTFSDIVDAADGLSVDEQMTLLEILRRRIAERNRKHMLREVQEARDEFARGEARIVSVADVLDEFGRED